PLDDSLFPAGTVACNSQDSWFPSILPLVIGCSSPIGGPPDIVPVTLSPSLFKLKVRSRLSPLEFVKEPCQVPPTSAAASTEASCGRALPFPPPEEPPGREEMMAKAS